MNLIKKKVFKSLIYNRTSCIFSNFFFISIVVTKFMSRCLYVSGETVVNFRHVLIASMAVNKMPGTVSKYGV